jgi:L,D-peptidoglycan transpeptidase YkuD (ErfK/YbiS/YcfS/YnhG family)|tara:strand:+ start:2112 stop:2606 length:495 start_codon:yes stop_codon:yes gene_type:complete
MLIILKNKETLKISDYSFRCSVGKNGIYSNKKEGDKKTPRGTYSLGNLYYRADRVKRPITKLSTKIIQRNTGWCDDSSSKNYNKEIKIHQKTKISHEKLFKKNNSYNYLIEIKYNNKPTPFKGSAIFIHLTNNYKKTAGCIALQEKDFLILIKLINKNTKIRIS